MLVLRNMDELLTMDLPSDCIAAAHACTCNPRGLSHYPSDWYALSVRNALLSSAQDPGQLRPHACKPHNPARPKRLYAPHAQPPQLGTRRAPPLAD